MSSQSSSSPVVRPSSQPTTSHKRLRRLRRPGPPDRLSWLGAVDANAAENKSGDDNGVNDQASMPDFRRSLDQKSKSYSDDEKIAENGGFCAGKKRLLSSGGNSPIDLTLDSDDSESRKNPRQKNWGRAGEQSISKNDDNAENGWICNRCTLFNRNDQSTCSLCDFRRKSTRNGSTRAGSSGVVRERDRKIPARPDFSDSDSNSESGIKMASKKSSKIKNNSKKSSSKQANNNPTAKSSSSKSSGSLVKESSSLWKWASSQSQSQSISKPKDSSHQRLSQSSTGSKKVKNSTKNQSTSKDTTSFELWINKHAPQNSSQLCVAPKKIEEVRQWLSSYSTYWGSCRQPENKNESAPMRCYDLPPDMQNLPPETKMMILVGSPGIGKSTLAYTLAKELKLEVLTWNDVQMDYNEGGWDGNMIIPYQSQLSSFEEFLCSGGVGMESLEVSSVPSNQNSSLEKEDRSEYDGSMILIEDIPNLHSAEAANKFRCIMERHLQRSHVPTIFVFSDVYEGKHKPEDIERLIPPHILYSCAVKILPIQPVTKPKMKRCLESIAKAEKLGRLIPEYVEELHLSSGGDLRHAIFAIQFQYGTTASGRKSISSGGAAKRDVKLSSFHALGKLLYAKRTPRGQDQLLSTNQCQPGLKRWDDGRGMLESVPENVLESTDMATGSALSFVAYHSPDFFTDVSDLSHAFDRLSDAGTFLDRFGGTSQGDGPFPIDYASSIGGRAVAEANKHPAPHQFRHFSTPKVFDVLKKQRGNEVKMDQLRKRLSIGSHHIAINSNIGSAHQFVTDGLPLMRHILPHEVEYALSNLHSYSNESVGNSHDDSVSQTTQQNQVLLEDDIVDDDDDW